MYRNNYKPKQKRKRPYKRYKIKYQRFEKWTTGDWRGLTLVLQNQVLKSGLERKA